MPGYSLSCFKSTQYNQTEQIVFSKFMSPCKIFARKKPFFVERYETTRYALPHTTSYIINFSSNRPLIIYHSDKESAEYAKVANYDSLKTYVPNRDIIKIRC